MKGVQDMRLKVDDTLHDIVVKMSDGNPGCVSFLLNFIKESYDGAFKILAFDKMELYGENLYKLWNDCCNREIDEVNKVLDAWYKGKISTQEIIDNVSKPYGTPFKLD